MCRGLQAILWQLSTWLGPLGLAEVAIPLRMHNCLFTYTWRSAAGERTPLDPPRCKPGRSSYHCPPSCQKHRNDTNTHSSKQPHPLTFHNTSIHSIATPLHSNIYSYFTTFHRYLSTFTVTGTVHQHCTFQSYTSTVQSVTIQLHQHCTFQSYTSTIHSILSELHQYIPYVVTFLHSILHCQNYINTFHM